MREPEEPLKIFFITIVLPVRCGGMEIYMVIIKLALIGIGGAVLAVVTGQFRKEYGVFILIAVALILNGYLLSNLKTVIDFIQGLSDRIQLSDTYLRLLYKLLAISFVSQISSGLCEDLGYKSVSFQIELIGKISILILSIPILNSLLETIDQLL